MDGMEGVEKEVQEGKDMYLIHFVVQEKPTHDCKVTIFPIQKKKKEERTGLSFIAKTLGFLPFSFISLILPSYSLRQQTQGNLKCR